MHGDVSCYLGPGGIVTWPCKNWLLRTLATLPRSSGHLARVGMRCLRGLLPFVGAVVYWFSPWRAGDNLAQIPALTSLLLASVSNLGTREVFLAQPKIREKESTNASSAFQNQMMLCAHRKLMGHLSSCMRCPLFIRSDIWWKLSWKET